MSQTPITVKIDSNVKQEAQKLARSLGLSLSAIIENKLKEVIRDRKVIFEEELIFNDKTAKELLEIEADIRAGRNVVGQFETSEALEKYLNSL